MANLALCGANGKLFAQIQADSDINENELEGNSLHVIRPAVDTLVAQLRDPTTIDGYISSVPYLAKRVAIADFIEKLYADVLLYDADSIANVLPLIQNLIDKLLRDGQVTLLCGIQQHALVVDLQLLEERLNITIYNTGAGLNFHSEEITREGGKYNFCLAETLMVESHIASKVESLRKILNTFLTNPIDNIRPVTTLPQFYRNFFRVKLLKPNTQLLDSEKRIIIGQRSGVCVWKSNFTFMRHKLFQAQILSVSDDLLFKYDVKMLSMLDMQLLLNSDEALIPPTLILSDAINFACANNVRLVKKINADIPVLDTANCEKALALCKNMRDHAQLLHKKALPTATYANVWDVINLGYSPVFTQFYKPLKAEPEQQPSVGNESQATKSSIIFDNCNAALGALDALRIRIEHIRGAVAARTETSDTVDFHEIITTLQACREHLLPDVGSRLKSDVAAQLATNMYIICQDYALKFRENGYCYGEERHIPYLLGCTYMLRAIHDVFLHNTEQHEEKRLLLAYLVQTLYAGLLYRVTSDPQLGLDIQELHDKVALFCARLNITAEFIYDYNVSDKSIVPCLIQHLTADNVRTTIQCLTLFNYSRMTSWLNGRELSQLTVLNKTRMVRSNIPLSEIDVVLGWLQAGNEVTILNNGYPSIKDEVNYKPRENLLGTNEVLFVGSESMLKKLPQYFASLSSGVCADSSLSANIYYPKAKTVSAEDAKENLLYSLFAEYNVSMQRINELVQERFNSLNEKLYRDIILMRLFSNNSVYAHVRRGSYELISLLEILKSHLLDIDDVAELSDRQIFLLHAYYKLAWNAQVIAERTAGLERAFVDRLSECIKESSKPKTKIKQLLTALGDHQDNLDKLNKRSLLLKLELLHFMLIDKTRGLDDDEVGDVLLLAVTLADKINSNKNGLSYVTSGFICNVLEKLSDTEEEKLNKVASRLSKVLDANSYDAKLNLQEKILEFMGANLPVRFSFITGISVGHQNLVPIPATFLENNHFNAVFNPIPALCRVDSNTRISLEYQGSNWTIVNEPSFAVYRDGANLIRGSRPIILNDKYRLPITLVDSMKELYAAPDHKMFVVDKNSKLTTHIVQYIPGDTHLKNSYTVTRHDGAELLFANEDNLYIDYYARFEDPSFIETWKIPTGGVQISLPRYGMEIYHQTDGGMATVKHKDLTGECILLRNQEVVEQFPHALFLHHLERKQNYIVLPSQQYIVRDSVLGFQKGEDAILYDTIAATNIYDSKKINQLYSTEIACPELNKYSATANLIEAQYTDEGVTTTDPATALHFAYYLLGQRNYHLAHTMLMQARKLRPDFTGCLKQLENIILHFPRLFVENDKFVKTRTTEGKKIRFGQHAVPQIALRVQALTFLLISGIKLPSGMEEAKNPFADLIEEGEALLTMYLENIKNIPMQYRLSVDDELLVFSHYVFATTDNGHRRAANFFKENYAKLLGRNSVSLQVCSSEYFYPAHGLPKSWRKPSELQNYSVVYHLGEYSEDSILQSIAAKMEKIDASTVLQPQEFTGFLRLVIDKPPEHDHVLKANYLFQLTIYTLHDKVQDNKLFYTYIMLYIINDMTLSEKTRIREELNKALGESRIDVDRFIWKYILKKYNAIFFKEATKQITTLFNLQTNDSSITIPLPIHSYRKLTSPQTIPKLFESYGFPHRHASQQPMIEAHVAAQPEWLSRLDGTIYERFKEQHLQDYKAGLQINRQQFSDELKIEIDAFNLNELQERSQALSTDIVTLFNKNMHSAEATLKLEAEQSLAPRNITQILQLFVTQSLEMIQDLFGLQADDHDSIYANVFEYLFIQTYIQRIMRFDYSQRAYNKDDSLQLIANCLLFEYLADEGGMSIYPQQIENIRYIIDTQDTRDALVQIPMGGGKSKVMLPIIAILNAISSNLSVLVVPQALFSTTMSDISLVTKKVYNKVPVVINYARDDLSVVALKKVLLQLQSARIKRNYVMMTPETLHALYLSRKEVSLLDIKPNTPKHTHMNECKELFADIFSELTEYGRCTIDEIDHVLSLQIEHNFASLAYQYVAQKFPKSINLCVNLFRALEKIPLPYAPEYSVLDMVRGADARKPSGEIEWGTVLDNISIYIAQNQEEIFTHKILPIESMQQAIRMRTNITSMRGLRVFDKDMLSVVKFELTELLSATIMTPYREEYGPKDAGDRSLASMVAIPYSDQMPIVGSEFSDPIATMNYTIQYVLHQYTIFSYTHIKTVADTILESIALLPADDREQRLERYADAFGVDKLTENMLIDRGFLEGVARDSGNNLALKFYILKEFILNTITENDYEHQSNAYTFNNIFASVSGFSGTIDNLHTYHPKIIFANQQQALGTNGVVIDTIYSKNTEVVTARVADSEVQLRGLVNVAITSGKKLHALIDLGAAFKAVGNNYAIARVIGNELRKNCTEISHVLFFDGNVLSALALNDDTEIIYLGSSNLDSICSKLNIVGAENYFTFYDQGHTRGVDIKQIPKAHAILTIGDGTGLSQLLQAAMRMRGFRFNSEQTLEFFVSREAINMHTVTIDWSLDDVMHYVLCNTLSMTMNDNLQAVYLLMQNELKTRVEPIAYTKAMTREKLQQALSSIRSGSLLARYGSFTQTTPIMEALVAYRNQILAIAKSFGIKRQTVQEIANECNRLIEMYRAICKPEVNAPLTGFKASNLKFVTKQQTELSEEEDQKYGYAVQAPFESYPSIRSSPRTWSEFVGYHTFENFVFGLEGYPYSNGIFSGSKLEKRVEVPWSVHGFYRIDNAPKNLDNITKHVYYIAELRHRGQTKYLLLDEELKNMVVLRLQGSPHATRWQLPIGDEFYIYTLHNNLEFAATNVANGAPRGPRRIPHHVMAILYTFNADVNYLLHMLDDVERRAGVLAFFAKSTDEKLDYIKQKVSIFRRDQLPFFADFKARLVADMILEPQNKSGNSLCVPRLVFTG